jgi:hypothetical protein
MAELRFPVPPLAGDVVLLRPWGETDLPGIVLAFGDPVMRRFSWRTAPYTEADARGYFADQEEARLRGEALDFALVGPATRTWCSAACPCMRFAWTMAARRSGTGSPPGVAAGVSRHTRSACSPGGLSLIWGWPGWS